LSPADIDARRAEEYHASFFAIRNAVHAWGGSASGKGYLVKPVLQALVVADHVYEDRSGKKIIAGTFNTYWFSKKPPIREVQQPSGEKQHVLLGGMRSGSPFAYVSLTDVCDGTVLTIQFVDLTRNVVLFTTKPTIRIAERVATIELVFPLPELPIQQAGVYALEVVCENEILGSYRITAQSLDEKKEQGPQHGDSGT